MKSLPYYNPWIIDDIKKDFLITVIIIIYHLWFFYYSLIYYFTSNFISYFCIYYITPCEFFTPAFSWWSFTEVWVTASFLRSQELFSVFWPTLTMLSFGWFLHILRFSTLPALLPSLWGSFQVHHLQLILLSPSRYIAILGLWQDLSICLFFSFSFILPLWSAGTTKSTFRQVIFFFSFLFFFLL